MENFELTVEGRQADEAVASLFHTVLFHRSLGKFVYNNEGTYTISTLGYSDRDCNFIDLTYVYLSSPSLDQFLRNEISAFSELLRGNESQGGGMGQISLEFFQRRSKSWIFQEYIPWEVWTVRLELISLSNEGERQSCRERVGEALTDKILYITEVVNRHEYLPKMPNEAELDRVFDTSFPDVQPYLFKLNYSVAQGPSSSSSVGSTMKKLFRETFAL